MSVIKQNKTKKEIKKNVKKKTHITPPFAPQPHKEHRTTMVSYTFKEQQQANIQLGNTCMSVNQNTILSLLFLPSSFSLTQITSCYIRWNNVEESVDAHAAIT